MSTQAVQITPFTISVPREKLDLLQKKLELATIPGELENSGWKYGVPVDDVVRFVNHWKTAFDWRKAEAQLNEELPQFTTNIEVEGHGTLNIHYIHKESSVAEAIPLLFVHGWPGSFIEVRKILPLLTKSDSDGPKFHVVAPSLPGFGFSDAPKTQGFGLEAYAEVAHKLMLRLGYKEYVTQGGDWGHMITEEIAATFGGKHAKAWHSNFPLFTVAPKPLRSPFLFIRHSLIPYNHTEKTLSARGHWFDTQGMGYYHEQATQPQTLGYALTDSPVGLLAWIYEKLVNWTDEYPWGDDEVLTWISIYLFSPAGPISSLRIYFEAGNILHPKHPKRSKIPFGVSYFPKELLGAPRTWIQNSANLVFESSHSSGGHFAAYEKPEELVDDLKKMFGKRGPAFRVVKDKSGYAA